MFAASVSSVSASSLGEEREMRMKGDYWGFFGCWSPAIFCQKLHIMALIHALVLFVLFLQRGDFTARLNSSTWGIAAVGREGRT